MNYELLSKLAMQESERLKSENILLIKKSVILEQEIKNLKEFCKIIEKEKDAYKQRAIQFKNENETLKSDKTKLANEIEKLESKLEYLNNKLIEENEKKREDLKEKNSILDSLTKSQSRASDNKDEKLTQQKTKPTSFEFYS